MSTSFDVIIVGAGVAGAVAALGYARAGASVLVVERKPTASAYKILCTHFIQPVALPVLRRLGLEEAILLAGGVPTKVAFWSKAGWIDPPGDYALRTSESDGSLFAINIERSKLDPLLKAQMAAQPNLVLLLDHEVDAVEQLGNGGWSVTLSGANAGPFTARALVVATGRQSRLADTLDNQPVFTGENHRACAFAYYEGIEAPPANRSLFMLGERDMAFLYPLGERRALLAAYIAKDSFVADWAGGDKAALLLDFFRSFPDLPSFDEARVASPVYGFSDYPNIMREPVCGGAAFIGDAALSLDPMSGVGCGFAALSASQLVATTVEPLLNQGDLASGLAAYAAWFTAYFRPHAQGISADSLIARSGAATASVYGRITESPALQRAFIALTGRLITPLEFQRAFLTVRPKTAARQAS